MAAATKRSSPPWLGWVLVVALLAGCSGPSEPTEADGGGGGASGDEVRCSGAFACVTFFVDDRANAIFDDAARLEWKGNFRLSEEGSLEIVPTPGRWDGPFPLLYDDGPRPDGHEMPGAVANDHIWSVIVAARVPTETLSMEYGAHWGGSNWIWSCNYAARPCDPGRVNGTLRLGPGDAGRVVDAPGLILPAHGDVDLRLALDTSALLNGDSDFKATRRVLVKGTYSGWVLRPCVDDGQLGDEVADDGIWTFTLSEMKARYDGLLVCGSNTEFVFVLEGSSGPKEYKVDGRPPTEGVSAYLKVPGGDWAPIPVVRDSGPDQNTMIATPACEY